MKKYFNINFKLKGLLFLGTLFLISSCVDLDENPDEARLSPTNLTTLKSLEFSIVGAYRAVEASVTWAGFWVNAYGGDDVSTHSAQNKIGFREGDRRTLTRNSERIEVPWEQPYRVIETVNNIIQNKDNFIDNDQTAIDIIVGEAYFIRAIYYMHLTHTFGKVPLNLTVELDWDLGLAEIPEIYAQIESDLLEAEKLLPENYPGVSAAIRPNSGSARAFLAKHYLHWAGWPLKDNSKYAMAASSAKQVIDNASAHGFALVEDMNTLWSVEDENRLNSEIVWAVGHCQPCGNAYSNRHSGRLGYASSVGGWNEIFAEIGLLEAFPEGPRKEATFVTEGELKSDDSDGIHKKGDVVNWRLFDNEAHPSFKKVTGHLDEVAVNNTNTSITTYFMRYADLLLMYAEAEGRAGGNSADAWEALNQVRRRAYEPGTPDLTSGDLAELAYEERRWELAGEFIRWGDLVRMERVAEALGANRSEDELVGPVSGDTSPANYFCPIPQSAIDKSPQLGG